MKLEEAKVAEACGRIERALAAFDAAPQDVAQLCQAHELLQWLRGQYVENRALLDGWLDRLKALREQVLQRLRRHAGDLSATFVEAVQATTAWQKRRDDCRALLVELAAADRLERLDCPQGHIEVKYAKSAVVPGPGTPQRAELYALLDAAQRWADVAVVNPLRLMKAVDQGLFTPLQVGQITKLCPVQSSARLTVRDR